MEVEIELRMDALIVAEICDGRDGGGGSRNLKGGKGSNIGVCPFRHARHCVNCHVPLVTSLHAPAAWVL